MNLAAIPLLAVTACALLGSAAPAVAGVPAGVTALIDRPDGVGSLPFDGVSGSSLRTHALSADGRFVVFTSDNDVLLAGDEDAATHVYRLDQQTGAFAQVDVTVSGTQGRPGSFSGEASISADGTRVAFFSDAQTLVPGAPERGVYVKDLTTGDVTLASRATGTFGAPVPSADNGRISGDGRHVVFAARAAVSADNATGSADHTGAYVRSMDSATTHLASLSTGGAQVGEVFDAPDIDFTGRTVAFVSSGQLSPDDTDPSLDAYVRTNIGRAGESSTLASFAIGQTSGATQGVEVALDGAGTHVAWVGAQGGIFSTFLSPAPLRAVRVDLARAGGSASIGGDSPAYEPVAAAGDVPNRLTFATRHPLDPADVNQRTDLYGAEVFHNSDPAFVHLESSGTSDGDAHGSAAGGGATVVTALDDASLPGGDGIHAEVYRQTAAGARLLSQPAGAPPRSADAGGADTARLHAVSADGRVVVFESRARALGAGRTQDAAARQVLARDVAADRTVPVSVAPDGAPGNRSSFDGRTDAAGRQVVFSSLATNLVAGSGPQGREHVYLRDLATGTTRLIDRAADGRPSADGADQAVLSADGRRLVYRSDSPDAPGRPAGSSQRHLYVVDLATGATQLGDRGADSSPANADAEQPDLSADGGRLAFASTATNLGAGDGSGARHLYVRDMAAGTTTWASRPASGRPQDAEVDRPSLSGDGRRVSFDQLRPSFGFGMTGPVQVFVADLEAGGTTLVSRDGTGGAFAAASASALSQDGRRVAFTSRGGPGPAGRQTQLRDLEEQTTTLVSADLEGAPTSTGAELSALSADGACVVFVSSSADLVRGGYGPDYDHVFLRGVAAACPALRGGQPGAGAGEPSGAGPGDGPGVATPPRDTTAPRLTAVRLSHRRFAPALTAARPRSDRLVTRNAPSQTTSHRASGRRTPRGTAVTFRLSEDASVTLTVTRSAAGRRNGKACVAPRPGLRRRCTRTVTEFTLVRAAGRRGVNRVALTGRTRTGVLRAGAHRLRLVARDRAGNRSRPITVALTVVRR